MSDIRPWAVRGESQDRMLKILQSMVGTHLKTSFFSPVHHDVAMVHQCLPSFEDFSTRMQRSFFLCAPKLKVEGLRNVDKPTSYHFGHRPCSSNQYLVIMQVAKYTRNTLGYHVLIINLRQGCTLRLRYGYATVFQTVAVGRSPSERLSAQKLFYRHRV